MRGMTGIDADITDWNTENTAYDNEKLNPKITTAGGGTLRLGAYWSSTTSGTLAYNFNGANGRANHNAKFNDYNIYVRAVFAF